MDVVDVVDIVDLDFFVFCSLLYFVGLYCMYNMGNCMHIFSGMYSCLYCN